MERISLNGCWPASSGWAFVDYYCLPKASVYSFKRCAKRILASVDKKDGYQIYVCNDGLSDEKLKLSVSYIRNGEIKQIADKDIVINSSVSEKVISLPASAVPEDALLICNLTSDGKLVDRAFYKSGTLPVVPTDSVRVVSKTENSITVTADKYVHAVELEGEFVFEDNYFSLLPGESRTVMFRRSFEAQSDSITVSGYTVAL